MPGIITKSSALICILLFRTCVFAQSPDSTASETFQFYVTGQIALPSEEFRKIINNSIDNLAVGGSAGFVLSPLGVKKPSPVLLGIDFSYLNYGVDKTPATPTLPQLKTTFNMITWNGMLRLRPAVKRSAITPFVDGLLGVKILNTVTKIDKDVSNIILNTDQPEVLNRVNNTGLNYGLGIGFTTNSKSIDGLGFMMRLLYMWGDDIKYVVRGSIMVDNNGYITYQTDTVNTSIFILQLGIKFSWIRNVGAVGR